MAYNGWVALVGRKGAVCSAGSHLVSVVEVQLHCHSIPILDLLLQAGVPARIGASVQQMDDRTGGQRRTVDFAAQARAKHVTAHNLFHVLAIRRVPQEVVGRRCNRERERPRSQDQTWQPGIPLAPSIHQSGSDTTASKEPGEAA